MLWVLFLLLAWAAAGVSCARLCLTSMRAAAADSDVHVDHAHHCHRLTLYEAAFLSGGPARVADLTLVSMAGRRRLLLAHTGWVTVVDPQGRDDLERSVIGAIGPGGQARIAPVRRTAAAAVKDETPGTTSEGMPSSSRRRSCSARAPYRLGSPLWTRATSCPRAWASAR